MKPFITRTLVLMFGLIPLSLLGQNVSINTDGSPAHPSAMLDIRSTTTGMLIPRMNTIQRNGISSPALGLLVFDTDENTFWFYDGSIWVEIVSDPLDELNTGMVLNNSILELTDAGGTQTTDLSSLIDDADADPNNELQSWSNLPGIPGGFVDGIDHVNDADNDPNNELQSLTQLGSTVSLSNGGGSISINDGDISTLNEIQSLSISGNMLSLSNGGGTVTIGTQSLLQDGDQDTKIQVEESADEDKIRFDLAGAEKMVLSQNPSGNTLLDLNVGMTNLFIGRNAGANNTGSFNTSLGWEAGKANTSGNQNTAMGSRTMYSNTTGIRNTVTGYQALYANTSGGGNVASGYNALYSNTTGNTSIAIGESALYNNTTRHQLIGIGYQALYNNGIGATSSTHATANTAIGYKAMRANTTGYKNTTTGYEALYSNTTGFQNTATGFKALYSNTTGGNNIATGLNALYSNTTGSNNTATGLYSLNSNTTGNRNTALGYYSLYSNTTGIDNNAIGYNSGGNLTSGIGNTFLGAFTSVPSTSSVINNSSAIGNQATVSASHQVRLGNSSVNSIGGYAAWTNLSDGAYKTNISEDIQGLEFITQLRPVSYQLDMAKLVNKLREDYVSDTTGKEMYRNPDPATVEARRQRGQVRHSGFIAQEVEQVAQELGFEFSGVDKPENEDGLYGLRYAEFVVPLVKAVQEQQLIIDQLLKRIEALEKASQ